MINPNYLCPGCMEVRNSLEGVCPHCGFDESKYRKTVSARVLLPGTILAGKYLLGKVLGEGGFGITYLGWDLNQEMPLAIKEYFPVNLATRDTLEGKTEKLSVISGDKKRYYEYGLRSFQEEAQNLSRFQKISGVVSVKDFFFENATAYLVMEYLEGKNLKQYLNQMPGKRISEGETLQIIRPIIEALATVHTTGIIHRDISPENIILTNDGGVKLIDFGAARVATGAETQSLTVLLKHGYAPMEQYQTRGKQGTWTDTYALCATMYRMLSGKTPEPSIDRILEDKVESLYEIVQKNPEIKITKKMSDAIQKGLSVKIEERYQKVDELKDALGIKEIEKASEKQQKEELVNVEEKNEVLEKSEVPEAPGNQQIEREFLEKDRNNIQDDKQKVGRGMIVFIIVFFAFVGIIFVATYWHNRSSYNEYETIEEHEEIQNLSDEDKEVSYEEKGWEALNGDDYESAEEYYKKSLEIQPTASNFLGFGEIYEEQGRIEQLAYLWKDYYKDCWLVMWKDDTEYEKKQGEEYLKQAVLAAAEKDVEWIPLTEDFAGYMNTFSSIFETCGDNNKSEKYQKLFIDILNKKVVEASNQGIKLDKLTELQKCFKEHRSFHVIEIEIMNCYEANLGISRNIEQLMREQRYGELAVYFDGLSTEYHSKDKIYYQNGRVVDTITSGVGLIWYSSRAYYGEISNGLPNGQGVQFGRYSDKTWGTVSGEMKSGKANGQCTYVGFFEDKKTKYSHSGNFIPPSSGDASGLSVDCSYENGTMTAKWQGHSGTYQATMGTVQALWTEGERKIYVQCVHSDGSKNWIYNDLKVPFHVQNYFCY